MHNKSVATGTGAGTLCVLRHLTLGAILAGAVAAGIASNRLGASPVLADGPEATVSTPTMADIASAKTNVANLYAAYRQGTVTYRQLRDAETALSAMTGESLKLPMFADGIRLAADYSPFRQVTDYWCGPATVQSILWYLGVRDEAAINNPESAKGMTGRADVDQKLLAGSNWLNTESYEGTNWGTDVPNAINTWRGTRWYAAFGTPNGGGELYKEQAWRNIQYAVDHGYPVAANVQLGPDTVTPTGFFEGNTYQHWETIVGYFEKDGVKYVKVGQVYGAQSLSYDPLQEIPWDAYWPAIGNHFGIVW